MRKWKTAKPLIIGEKLRRKAAQARSVTDVRKSANSSADEDFDATMARAFPKHLRGSISGCCDSMESGHGIAEE